MSSEPVAAVLIKTLVHASASTNVLVAVGFQRDTIPGDLIWILGGQQQASRSGRVSSSVRKCVHHLFTPPPITQPGRRRLYGGSAIDFTENVILFVTDDSKESKTQSLSPGCGGERLQLPNSKPAALFNVPSGSKGPANKQSARMEGGRIPATILRSEVTLDLIAKIVHESVEKRSAGFGTPERRDRNARRHPPLN